MQAGDSDGETTKIKDIRWVDEIKNLSSSCEDHHDKEEGIIDGHDAHHHHHHLHHGKEEHEKENEKEKEKDHELSIDSDQQQQPPEGPPTAS